MMKPYKIRKGSRVNPDAYVLTDPDGRQVPGQRTTKLISTPYDAVTFVVEFLVGDGVEMEPDKNTITE